MVHKLINPAGDAIPRRKSSASGAAAGPGLLLPVVLVFVQFCFGSFPVAGKIALEAFSPAAISLWRIAVGCVVLLFVARKRAPGAWIPRRGLLLRILLVGQLGVSMNQILFIEGLSMTPAVHAGLIMAIIPSATFAAALLLRRERWCPRRAAGIAVAFLGAALLILWRGGSSGGNEILGHLLLVANACCYSLYLVLLRPLVKECSALVVTAWSFCGSVPTALLYALVSGKVDFASLGDAGVGPSLALLWILAFPTLLAYLMNIWALSWVPASTTAIYINLQPLIAGILAVVLIGESIAAPEIACAALVLLGLRLVTRVKK